MVSALGRLKPAALEESQMAEECLKKFPMSLIIREMQIKTMFTVGVQTFTATMETNMVVSKKTGNLLPQDSVIQLLGIFPKDINHQSTCSIMFTLALFIIART